MQLAGTDPLVDPAADVELTDPGSIADRLADAVSDLAGDVVAQLPLLLLAVVVLVVSLLLVSLANRGITRATSGTRFDPSVARLVQTMSRVVLILLALLLSLSVAGVDVGSALAALGIAGLAVAFAVQSILENFIAGVLILLRRPFRPGDQVVLGEYQGTVEDVNLRVTRLVDFDGELVLLPNNTVFSAPIVNLTERGRRRSEVTVGVEYRDDHDRAREVLLRAVSEVDGVLAEPPPLVLLTELNSSSVDFRILYWTLPTMANVLVVRDRVLGAAKRAIEDAGMTIPWPIRTLVVDESARSLFADRARQDRDGAT